MEVYDEYMIDCWENIAESELIQHRLRMTQHIDLTKIWLDNDDELINLWNICSIATKITFPEDFASKYSVTLVKSLCEENRIREIIFEGYQLENIFDILKRKNNLISVSLDSSNNTYQEIIGFINNNISTMKDLDLTLGYPEITLQELDNILHLITTNIDSYYIHIGDSKGDQEWEDIIAWVKDRNGIFGYGDGMNDEGYTIEFSS